MTLIVLVNTPQEIVSIYPMLSPPTLTAGASNRVCNALALLQVRYFVVYASFDRSAIDGLIVYCIVVTVMIVLLVYDCSLAGKVCI